MLTQIFGQSSNPVNAFISRISPPFCFEIPNPSLQVREIPDPEKPIRGTLHISLKLTQKRIMGPGILTWVYWHCNTTNHTGAVYKHSPHPSSSSASGFCKNRVLRGSVIIPQSNLRPWGPGDQAYLSLSFNLFGIGGPTRSGRPANHSTTVRWWSLRTVYKCYQHKNLWRSYERSHDRRLAVIQVYIFAYFSCSSEND